MECGAIVKELDALADAEAVEGMARFGITSAKVYGVSIPALRKIARRIGKNHELAQELWMINSRETRILASMVDDPRAVTEAQLESWAKDFDFWEICDQCCQNLFEKTPFAYRKCVEWSRREEEYVKRAGFVLMARLAVSDKKAADERFEEFLPIIKREAGDGRKMVRKAVNWALRQIGKRNLALHQRAVETAQEIREMEAKSAKWVASDALRELTGEAVHKRLRSRASR